MSPTDTCKRNVEITIPAAEVAEASKKAATDIQSKAKMPGFRPGKVPMSVILKRFAQDIRQTVVEELVPKAFRRHADAHDWKVAGNPSVPDVHFHDGEEIHFKAEYEVAPEFELGEYRGIEAVYEEPKAAEEDIDARVNQLRDTKAEFVNIDPRPIADGDFAVVGLKSIQGVEGDPVESNETVLEVGGADSMPAFSEALRGASPGAEMDVEITYPEEYGHEKLAGRTVKFHVEVKGLRRKELPELNDEFAKDLGDFQSMEELRAEVRRSILREREIEAQNKAKTAIVDKLIDSHAFAVPEAWVDAQIESTVSARLRELAGPGVDLAKLKIDWNKVKEMHQERAVREVKASLILGKIAEREAIETMMDEVDREVTRAAKQLREPVAAVRMKFEKDGTMHTIASRIRTDKVLGFLFEQARKTAAE